MIPIGKALPGINRLRRVPLILLRIAEFAQAVWGQIYIGKDLTDRLSCSGNASHSLIATDFTT